MKRLQDAEKEREARFKAQIEQIKESARKKKEAQLKSN